MHLSRTCAPLPESAYATLVISIPDLSVSLPLSLSRFSPTHTHIHVALANPARSRAPFVVARDKRAVIYRYLPTRCNGISRNRRVSISPIYSILRVVVTPRINDRESTTCYSTLRERNFLLRNLRSRRYGFEIDISIRELMPLLWQFEKKKKYYIV